MPDSITCPTEAILSAYRAGHQTLLVSGRPLHDLDNDSAGTLRPLRHTLLRRVKEEFGMVTLNFNLALGARWLWDGFAGDDPKIYQQRLDAANLPFVEQMRQPPRGQVPHEAAFALLAGIQHCIEAGQALPPMLVWFEFAEDLVPCTEQGRASDLVLQMNELLTLMASDYRRRKQPFLLMLTGVPESMDRRVVSSLHPVRLPLPDRDDKLAFLSVLEKQPHVAGARLEEGLDAAAVANLSARTPNRSLEESYLESARTGQPVTVQSLMAQKREDVVALSEGTLSLLDIERVQGVKLAGRTIGKVLALLQRWANGIKTGNPLTPMNVLLAGAPATAKTDLCLMSALTAQVPAYNISSPKGSLVGQTEQRVRLLFRVFKEMSPAFGFIDEVTEAFQMERQSMNMDSGATAAVVAEMLSALSDSSRAGRTLILATTNCPWKVGSAMSSRFLFVPVLSPVEPDYAQILCSIASRLLPEWDWDAEASETLEAARLFYEKGATPRHMRALLSSKISTGDNWREGTLLLQAAGDCAEQHPRDRISAEYADLYAISVCSDRSMLPWHGNITDYPLPDYLKGIVSETDGSVDAERLQQRIQEIAPKVNV